MKKIIVLISSFLFMSCVSQKTPVKTVNEVSLERYAGLWYEIARLPARFQKYCECTTAEYTLSKKNYVRVKNSCRKKDSDERTSLEGKAFIVPNTGNARLKVQFFWPFKGDYRIIALGDDYSYAMVGTNSRKYLWILSRTKQMNKDTLEMLVESAREQGYPVEKLIYDKQDCSR